MSRSLAKITKADLRRLGRIAHQDQVELFARNPDTGRRYRRRLFAMALCQGAALHYIDGKNEVKDFDVWCFYTASPEAPFPFRRRGKVDFGSPKFGVTDESPQFLGRRVDVIGRSLTGARPNDPVGSIRDYLATGKTVSARLLAQKAAILLYPASMLGTVVWPSRKNT